MSNIPDTIDYIGALMNAIIQGRITAEQVRDMTPEQRAEYKEKLITEERAELDRGKQLLADSEEVPSE